nr:MAG TPA: hypothetical protein [Bacteriophage sp.]
MNTNKPHWRDKVLHYSKAFHLDQKRWFFNRLLFFAKIT